MVTVAVVVPEEFRVQVQLVELEAMDTHDPTVPLSGEVPAVTVSRAQMLFGAELCEMYHGFGEDPAPPIVAV